MPPAGFSAATVLDRVRAGETLQSIADAHSLDEISGAVRDALTGLRLGVSALDGAALQRVAGLELWSIAQIAGHVLLADEAAHRIASSLAAGLVPAGAAFPYGVPGAAAAGRDEILAAIGRAEARLADLRGLGAAGPTYPHDELGALSARGWILLSGLHAAAHLHQAAAVMRAR